MDGMFVAAAPIAFRPSHVMCEGLFRLGVRRPLADAVMLEVIGDVDMVTAPMMWSVVCWQIATTPRVIVLDLHGVRFLGAAGLAVLASAREMAQSLGVTLRLARPSRAVARPLSALRLTGGFEVRRDVVRAITDPA